MIWLALALPLPRVARAVELICADGFLSVAASTPEAARFACGTAIDGKAEIVACGLEQRRPIRIELVDRLEHPAAECLAAYNCADEVIQVTDPAAIDGLLGPDSPYRRLPVDGVFRAILTHELAHALLSQSAEGRDIAFVDHEYVAAALELESLEPEWRAALIEAAPVALPATTGLISPLIYALAPRSFATNAWEFFHAEPDGCARIREIAGGTFTFSGLPR